jgi:Holliday junction resolvase
MSDEDFEIEDLLGNFEKKKARKKNTSKKTGNRGERELAGVFADRFEGEKFFRVVGSGNRWSHVDLTDAARGVLTGDIVCPPHFKFVVECKYGYADIELCGIFSEGHKQFDEWLKKARRDAESLKKLPILCWRKQHYEWLAFIPWDLFKQPINFLKYHAEEAWAVVSLAQLLGLPNEFWFAPITKQTG